MTNFRPSMYLRIYIYIVYEWCRNLTLIRYDTHNLNQNIFIQQQCELQTFVFTHTSEPKLHDSQIYARCVLTRDSWKSVHWKSSHWHIYMAHTECPVDGIQRSTHVWQYNSNSINICVIRELMYDQECGSHAHTPTHTHTHTTSCSHKSNRYLAQIMNEPLE